MSDEPTDTVEAAREAVMLGVAWYVGEQRPAALDAFEVAVRADERSKAQPEGALRAAARALWHTHKEVFPQSVEHSRRHAEKMRACWVALAEALDGTPREPSVEEVERAYDVFWQTRAFNSNANPRDNELESLRAALKAVR